MKVLVTGATGYIGAHVVKALYNDGHEVWGTDYDNKQNDISKYIQRYYHFDMREYNGRYDRVDKIVHIGAVTKVHNSVKDPYNHYLTNVIGTKNVMEGWPCKHFIYCSTGSAFVPQSNPYAGSKHAGELITQQFYPQQNSIVRFYNVSGNNGFSKYDDEMSHLIRKAARVVNHYKNKHNSSEHKEFYLYGTDYDTRDGTTIRNYTHVTDIADSMVSIVNNEPSGKIDCLGSPDGVTVKEVIQTMKKVSGVDFPVIYKQRRPGDVAVSTVPYSSPFFKQTKTLWHMCKDALEYEK